MSKTGKTFAILLTITIAVSCLTFLTVKPSKAQVGVTNPSVPSFGFGYEPLKWYVSPSYGVDPTTGKAIMTHEGYYKINRYAILSISNQPFQPYIDDKGNSINLYYEIQWKSHDSQTWQNLLPEGAQFTQNKEFYLTAISIGFVGNPDRSGWYIDILDYVPNNQYDFQVRALIGYYNTQRQFVGQTSDWSNTQTFTVPNDNLPTPSATVPTITPTPKPTAPDINSGSTDTITLPLNVFAAIMIVMSLVVTLSVLFFRRHRKTIKLS